MLWTIHNRLLEKAFTSHLLLYSKQLKTLLLESLHTQKLPQLICNNKRQVRPPKGYFWGVHNYQTNVIDQ